MAEVDALDERVVAELAIERIMHPIDAFLRTNLITAKAVARHRRAAPSGHVGLGRRSPGDR